MVLSRSPMRGIQIANRKIKKDSMKKIKFFFLSIAICSALSLQALLSDAIMQQIKDMGKEKNPTKSQALMKKIIKDNQLQAGKDAETIDMMKGNVAMEVTGNVS